MPFDPGSSPVAPEQSLEADRLERWIATGTDLPVDGARFAGVSPLAKGLLLAALSQRTARPLLAVFNDKAEARAAIDHFSFFAGRQAGAERAHYLPAADFDYYRGLLPNPETLCERNVGLFHALDDPERRVFVTTVGALLQKVVPAVEFLGATKKLVPGAEVDRDAFIHGLIEAGYQRQPTVYDPGVFTVRGGVIDVFCPLYRNPIRVEFFGDLVEEVRFFEAQSQRSLDALTEAYLIPVGQSLIPRGEAFLPAAEKVKSRLDHLGIPKMRRDEILEKIQEAVISSELGFLFPLLSRGSSSLLEYLPENALVLWDGKERILETARDTELPRLYKSHELFEKEPQPIAERQELFLSLSELGDLFDRPGRYVFEAFDGAPGTRAARLTMQSEPVNLAVEREGMRHKSATAPPLEPFARRFRGWMELGYRVEIACHTRTHAERLQMLFAPYGLRGSEKPEGEAAFPTLLQDDYAVLNLRQGFLGDSQVFPGLKLVLVSEEELFGQKKRAARASAWKGTTDAAKLLGSFRDIKVSDYVVHKDFGIGRYLGLKSMEFAGIAGDYVLLEYRDGDKLYIPVYRLNVLQKYVGGEGAAPVLDKMGGDRWLKAKTKAQRAVAELAAEFLNIQAKRKLADAAPCSPPGTEYGQFEMEFPFDETPDQLKAIHEVNEDLSLPHPMDRLVCGDVGYGKTEVAMRAAYRAVIDGKQVGVLVPTTVLAFQHFETFKQRFKSSGARIEMVSRMRSAAEVKQVLAELKSGKVDVVIGTHRLLSGDVEFRNLGLVVIDEEHRFGVVHKERLKKLTESLHVLSMTATPIPRTLNMAMAGIKDVSIITTPPPDRLSVRTFVCRSTPEVIAEAVTNELAREGQVFFVHNRIESIYKLAEDLRVILPKIRMEIAHGQMEGEELENKMLSFYRGDAQVLLSTAIIESGLDIPRANTIIIDQAHYFGLAQLYQLRGRVGRAAKRGYCYLLTPGENQMNEEAKQRLQVIQRYTDLGSGFSVASHDLEIRGAGDLLGKEQSGHLTAVGIDMYFELLEESIRLLRGQEKAPEIEPEIAMKISAFFPADYLPDVTERILLYRRLSSVEADEQVSEIETEIRDRFGAPPPEVLNLLGLMTLKLYLKRLHVVRMSCGPKKTSLQFAPSTPASPQKLVALVQRGKGRYAMTPDQKLVFTVQDTDWKGQLSELRQLCHQLGVD